MPLFASPTSKDAGDLNRRMRRDNLYSAQEREIELAKKPPGPTSQQPDRWKRLLRSQEASERRPSSRMEELNQKSVEAEALDLAPLGLDVSWIPVRHALRSAAV
jgi:hypothetical protein